MKTIDKRKIQKTTAKKKQQTNKERQKGARGTEAIAKGFSPVNM